MDDQHRLLTEAQAAELLAVAPATLRNWRSLKTKTNGPTWRKLPGGAIRYPYAALTAWIQGCESGPGGAPSDVPDDRSEH